MTITLDIKELREFENKTCEWGTRRGLVAVEEITKYYREQTLYGAPLSPDACRRIQTLLEVWDRQNPPPKLIPDL